MPSANAVKVLARDWKVEINTGTTGAPVWTEVKGLNSLTFNKSKNDADTTDFKSAGNAEHIVASRSRSVTLEGFYLEDPADKARDAGQAAVETSAEAVGVASLKQYRITTPAGTLRTFSASVNVGGTGGGNDDPTSWSAELTVSGTVTVA